MKFECPKPGAIKNIPPPTCGPVKRLSVFERLAIIERSRLAVKEQLVNTACVMVLEMSSPEGSPVSLSFWRAEVNRLQIELYGIEADIQRITGNV